MRAGTTLQIGFRRSVKILDGRKDGRGAKIYLDRLPRNAMPNAQTSLMLQLSGLFGDLVGYFELSFPKQNLVSIAESVTVPFMLLVNPLKQQVCCPPPSCDRIPFSSSTAPPGEIQALELCCSGWR